MSSTFSEVEEAFHEHGKLLSNIFPKLNLLSELLGSSIDQKENNGEEDYEVKGENKEKKENHIELSQENQENIINALQTLHEERHKRNYKVSKLMKHYDKHFDILADHVIKKRIEQKKKKYQSLLNSYEWKTQIKVNYLLLKLIYVTSSANVIHQPVPSYDLNERAVNFCNVSDENDPVWEIIKDFENLKSESEFEAVISKSDEITKKLGEINFTARMEKIQAAEEVDVHLAKQLAEVIVSLSKIKAENSESENLLFSTRGNSIKRLLSQFDNMQKK